MAFLLKLFKGAAKHKREYPNIRQGTDPLEQWQKIGELGDGSFGKVFKVRWLYDGLCTSSTSRVLTGRDLSKLHLPSC